MPLTVVHPSLVPSRLDGCTGRFLLRMIRVLFLCVCVSSVFLTGCAARNGRWWESDRSKDLRHRVSSEGETLGQISQWYTGKVSNWRKIQSHNSGLNPRNLKVGQLIAIPHALVRRSTPMNAKGIRSYVVTRDRQTEEQQLITGRQPTRPATDSAGLENTERGTTVPESGERSDTIWTEATKSFALPMTVRSDDENSATLFAPTTLDASAAEVAPATESNVTEEPTTVSTRKEASDAQDDDPLLQEQLREKLYDAILPPAR